MCEKRCREFMLFVEHARHQFLLNPGESAACHRGGRCSAQRLAREAFLAEELTGAQSGEDGFLAFWGYN